MDEALVLEQSMCDNKHVGNIPDLPSVADVTVWGALWADKLGPADTLGVVSLEAT